jgi:hypothetical protein
MIVFEEQVERLVNVLPQSVDANNISRPIKYDWGTIEVLNKYLLMATQQTPYPLIWLVPSKDTNDLREPSVSRKARFIFATLSYNPDEFNRYQYQYDFKETLQPIVDNFLIALSKSGISRYDDTNFETERVPNYSVLYKEDNDDKSKTNQIAVWNAIILDVMVTFSGGNCLKQIFYND